MVEEEKQIGRPSSFNEGMIEKTREYISFFLEKRSPEEMENEVEVIPSVAGLALYLGVARSTVYEWAKQNKDFSDTLEDLLGTQEVSLLNGGLRGRFNPTISKLLLANHGYSDKQEVDNKSSDGSMTPKSTMTNEQVKEIVQELKEEI